LRNAACALCNLRVHELITHYPALSQHGLVVIAVFESPHAAMLEYVGRQDAPFPLLADPEAQLYDLYSVEASEAKLAHTIPSRQSSRLSLLSVSALSCMFCPLLRMC
jgi:peroxiredoxin Q/BCP